MALINPQFQKLASFLSLDIFTDRHGAVNLESGEQIRKLPGFPLIIGKYLVFDVKNLQLMIIHPTRQICTCL